MRKLIFLLAAATVVAAAYIAGATPAAEATTSAAEDEPATLSLTLGAPASFGAFTPGVARDYTAGTTALVTSTAGNATLTVHDASTAATGHLVNGAFSLPQALQASASSPVGTGAAFSNVGGSASPLTLLTYSAPVSNDPATLQFRQRISANDALRTGSYAKTLTFTLSTTDGSCSLSLPLFIGSWPSSETVSCDSAPGTLTAEATPAEATMSVGGTVPATLALSLGAPASFGAFTPCVTRTYLAGTTANVISTAGDALLTVHDASTFATGHLVNGAFSLPQPLQARATSSASTGGAFNNVGSSVSPLNLLIWNGPISNDAVSLQYSQLINAVDALQSGTYAKGLTFTLSSIEMQSTVSLSSVSGSATSCGPTTAFAISPTSPNGSGGWYKGSSPTVTLTSTGGTSGIAATHYTVQGGPAQTYTGPFTLPDGDSVVVTYWATDNAGNVEPTNTSATYKVDTVAPSVTLTTPLDGAIYRQGATVAADYSCDDATSGVASCAGPTDDGEPIDTSTLGWHTFTVDAGDEAGNEAAPVSHSYFVAVTSTSKPRRTGKKVQIGPGTTVRVGYDFKLPGKHPAVQVLFAQPQVEFAVTCVSSGVTTSLVVPMADFSQSVPAKSTGWLPSGDHKSSLVYQGSLTVPGDLCGGGQALLGQARFSAGILAGETVKLTYRWHFSVNGTGGGWSGPDSLTPTLLPTP